MSNLTISEEANPLTIRKKIYANEEGILMGLPENPHFEITETRFREGFTGGAYTMEELRKYMYKAQTPIRGVVVAVGTKK